MRAVTSRLKPRITASATSITATDTATETTAMRDITPGPVLRRGAGGAARYEKFEVQTTAIFTVKFHAK